MVKVEATEWQQLWWAFSKTDRTTKPQIDQDYQCTYWPAVKNLTQNPFYSSIIRPFLNLNLVISLKAMNKP